MRTLVRSVWRRDLGYYAGVWHDLGKFHPEFHRYIREERSTGVDHKIAGALVAQRHAQLLAPIIEGHHGGLPAIGEFKRCRLGDEGLRKPGAAAIAMAEGKVELQPGSLTFPAWRLGIWG